MRLGECSVTINPMMESNCVRKAKKREVLRHLSREKKILKSKRESRRPEARPVMTRITALYREAKPAPLQNHPRLSFSANCKAHTVVKNFAARLKPCPDTNRLQKNAQRPRWVSDIADNALRRQLRPHSVRSLNTFHNLRICQRPVRLLGALINPVNQFIGRGN